MGVYALGDEIPFSAGTNRIKIVHVPLEAQGTLGMNMHMMTYCVRKAVNLWSIAPFRVDTRVW